VGDKTFLMIACDGAQQRDCAKTQAKAKKNLALASGETELIEAREQCFRFHSFVGVGSMMAIRYGSLMRV
jgi:hypothetical protein